MLYGSFCSVTREDLTLPRFHQHLSMVYLVFVITWVSFPVFFSPLISLDLKVNNFNTFTYILNSLGPSLLCSTLLVYP